MNDELKTRIDDKIKRISQNYSVNEDDVRTEYETFMNNLVTLDPEQFKMDDEYTIVFALGCVGYNIRDRTEREKSRKNKLMRETTITIKERVYQDVVYEKIKSSPKTTSELLKGGITAEKLSEIIAILVNEGKIRAIKSQTGGRPRTVYMVSGEE